MSEDLSKSPVAVRLAYRYPNGSMVSYSARAIARQGDSMTVVVNEFFDDGITLAVHAPFLEGLTNFRVISVARSIKKAGYFETLLRPAEAVPVGPGNGMGDPGFAIADAKSIPEAAAEAAGILADRMELEPPMRFSEALRGVPAEVRPMALVVSVAAAVHCMDARGLIEARALLKRTRLTGGKLPAGQQHATQAVRKAG
jgi:hypothetical protein